MKKIKQVARKFREMKADILDEAVKVFLRRRHLSWTQSSCNKKAPGTWGGVRASSEAGMSLTRFQC